MNTMLTKQLKEEDHGSGRALPAVSLSAEDAPAPMVKQECVKEQQVSGTAAGACEVKQEPASVGADMQWVTTVKLECVEEEQASGTAAGDAEVKQEPAAEDEDMQWDLPEEDTEIEVEVSRSPQNAQGVPKIEILNEPCIPDYNSQSSQIITHTKEDEPKYQKKRAAPSSKKEKQLYYKKKLQEALFERKIMLLQIKLKEQQYQLLLKQHKLRLEILKNKRDLIIKQIANNI